MVKVTVFTFALALASPSFAQTAGHPAMPGMTAGAPESSKTASMMSSMDKMMKDMAAVPTTGDADRDFVAMMMPHHQGAVDMARFELAHGKDPAMRKMAREIVAAQEKELAQMKRWQAAHPAR